MGINRIIVLTGLLAVIIVGAWWLNPQAKPAIVAPRIFVPLSNGSALPPTLPVEADILVYVSPQGKETILTARNEHARLPMASVTKLMTAYTALKEYSATDTITMFPEVLVGKGRSGLYSASTTLSFDAALHALLIPSHDEIADALAFESKDGTNTFVARMNTYARFLKLSDTAYVNPSGLDPNNANSPTNHSSAYDIYRLLRNIKENEPSLFAITGEREYSLADIGGKPVAPLTNTNPLLGESIGLFRVIGGKTGQTPRADEALAIAADAPCRGVVYAAVLRSNDRAADMRTLLTYGAQAFDWDCSK